MKLIYDGDQLVGAIIFEDQPTVYYLLYHPIASLRHFLADYLRTHSSIAHVMIPQDDEMITYLTALGFKLTRNEDPISYFERQSIDLSCPTGYSIQRLADEANMHKVHEVLWRGFDHGDDITYDATSLAERDYMFSSPHFNRQWAYVATHHDRFVCFVGIWYLPGSKTALLEPVATVPDHRRRGLATACIYHAIQAVKDQGCTHIYVGSDQALYRSIGFTRYDALLLLTRNPSTP